METYTYTIPEVKREDVEKLIAARQKKAEKYGATLKATFGKPYAKEIEIREIDPATQTIGTVGTEMYEVFDLTIESETIKKDGYTVVAKIEHLEGGNVVSSYEDHKPEWTTMKAHCDHCNGNHGQRVTFIVRHESGEEKQVGRTCLKDYCGIDPQAIGRANELNEILIGMDAERFDFMAAGIRPAHKTIDALALAVEIMKAQGYRKSDEPGSNRDTLKAMMVQKVKAEEAAYEQAEELAKAIEAMSNEEAYGAALDNVKTLLHDGYCKLSHMGYIAYAPLGYERHMERLAKDARIAAEKAAERESSKYVGEIGQRITIQVAELKLLSSWDTEWGTTFLYKITDTDGNTLVWFASRGLWEEEQNAKTIKATVKDHTERDGIKQTVVTRCKVAA